MTTKEDIDFIKWMCDKAEGFTFKTDPVGGREYHIVRYEHTSDQKYDFVINPLPIDHWSYYPLLLQRAIEGVNKPSEGFFITQTCDEVFIYHFMEVTQSEHFKLEDMTEDQAKESALKHIYEQETK